MGKSFYDIEDVKRILGVSDSKGYEYIRIMNQELVKRGYLTVRGKVPVRYFNERFFGAENNEIAQ